MPPTSPPPRDVADVLDAIAKRIRADPSFAAELMREPLPAARVSVSEVPAAAFQGEPEFAEVDLVQSASHVTVTAQTNHADQSAVHVSVMDRLLILCLGEGSAEQRREVALPCDVDEDLAQATFRNGVLDVVFPRRDAITHDIGPSRAK